VSPLTGQLTTVLDDYLPGPIVGTILESGASRAKVDLRRLRAEDISPLLFEIHRTLRLFVSPATRMEECMRRLRAIGGVRGGPVEGVVVVAVESEADIVVARSLARDCCYELRFGSALPTKVATVVSELARNVFQYAGRGKIEIRPLTTGRVGIEIVAKDEGKGIGNLEEVLSGKYRSKRGMGMGLVATKRLMDSFDIATSPAGTTVTVRKYRE
jgi:serine/threonine-protein kinase RsbT